MDRKGGAIPSLNDQEENLEYLQISGRFLFSADIPVLPVEVSSQHCSYTTGTTKSGAAPLSARISSARGGHLNVV